MKQPKVAIIYDTKEDYGIDSDDLNFCDFSYLSEVEYVQEQLNYSGYETLLIHPPKALLEIIKEHDQVPFDIIFNMVEGYQSRNREGIIPAICEAANIRYIGPDAFAASFTLHKYQTKLFISSFDIITPESLYFDLDINNLLHLQEQMEYRPDLLPAIIKPNREGFSMGLRSVDSIDQTIETVQHLSRVYQQPLLIEKRIEGMDIVSAVFGSYEEPHFLGIGQELNDEMKDYFLFDSKEKLNPKRITKSPALSEQSRKTIEEQTLLIYKALKLRDVVRIDWRVTNSGVPYFLECTPLPAWGPTSVFNFFSEQNSMTYAQLLGKIIQSALERQ